MYIIDTKLYIIAYKCGIIMRNPNSKMATTTEQLLRYELTEHFYRDLFFRAIEQFKMKLVLIVP